MSFDNNIIVEVSTDAPPVVAQGFGVVLWLASPGTLGGGFTERVRFYENPQQVVADLALGDLSQAAADALDAAMAQEKRVQRLAMGRIDAGTAQISDVTVAGVILEGEIFEIILEGYRVTHVALVAPTPTSVAAALKLLLDALPIASKYTIGVVAGVITLTHLTGSVPFDVLTETDSVGGTITPAVTTPATDPTTDMDALLLEQPGFYSFASEEKGDGWNKDFSAWGETNKRVWYPQSASPEVLTAVTTDLFSVLKGLSREYTALCWHSDDSEEFAFVWPVFALEANPDVKTTIWYYKTLSGITPQSQLTLTQQTNITDKNGNLYSTLKSAGASGPGVTAIGRKIDVRLTLDWTKARIEESLAQLFLTSSNANSKLGYDDPGITQTVSAVKSPLKIGESAKHYLEGSTDVPQPLRSQIPSADVTARILRLAFSGTLAGAIENADVNGFVSVSGV